MPAEVAQTAPKPFFSLDPAALDSAVAAWGWPKFRAQQLRDWVYKKSVADPDRMTNLAKRDRDMLRTNLVVAPGAVARRQLSEDGTLKLLLDWGVNEKGTPIQAETVMIPDGDRHTACVSSQVGCPVGCKFCASGMNGVKGSLTAAQIVEQVFALNVAMAAGEESTVKDQGSAASASLRILGESETEYADPTAGSDDNDDEAGDPSSAPAITRRPAGSPRPASGVQSSALISNIVFMGMGEPLANYANVMQAVRILHDPKCFNLGARRITISTVGVPAKMRELAHEQLPLNLAISLHAPNEPLRKQLIPWAEHFPLHDILNAARYYFDQTGREVTLEYILLHNVNDRPEHARELAKLVKTLRANVNLIRYNEVEGLPYIRPKSEDVVTFQNILRNANVNAHVRKSRGRDIDAACGQLRRKEQERKEREQLITLTPSSR
jgi:23S rRNA (adenine2503-C2)-methyltransferase